MRDREERRRANVEKIIARAGDDVPRVAFLRAATRTNARALERHVHTACALLRLRAEAQAMRVSEVMTKDVKTCAPNDDMRRAAEIMWNHDCGCVPIVDADARLVGLITDRDICMAAFTRGLPLSEMTVASGAAHVLFTVKPTDTLTSAETLMRQKQVRRLPVLDADGSLVGILSLNDIARHIRKPTVRGEGTGADEIAATLAIISQPRIKMTVQAAPPSASDVATSHAHA